MNSYPLFYRWENWGLGRKAPFGCDDNEGHGTQAALSTTHVWLQVGRLYNLLSKLKCFDSTGVKQTCSPKPTSPYL